MRIAFFFNGGNMLYQILPKYDYQFSKDNMLMFLKTLSVTKKQNKKERFLSIFNNTSILDYCFIMDCQKNLKGEEHISFYFRINNSKQQEAVLNSLQILFQDHADVFQVDELSEYKTIHTLFNRNNDYELDTNGKRTKKSLATYNDDQIFMFILGSLQHNTRITIDFSVRKSKIASNKSLFRGVSSDVELDVLLRVSAKTKYQRNIIMGISNNITNLTAGESSLNIDYRNSYKFSCFKGIEILNLFQIPTFLRKEENDTLKRINRLHVGQRTLKDTEFASGIKCGNVSHPMQNREVRLSEKQLRKHAFITGQTGSGKTSVGEEMMKDILERKIKKHNNVPGFTFFDPAETSALGIMDMILKLESDGHDISELIQHVHYIDFDYDDCVFPISLLNKGMPATEIIDFFKMLFGDIQAIQVERNMTSSINALLMDSVEHTITDVPKLFQDEEYRKELSFRLSHNIYAADTLQFLKSKFNSASVDPILNRTDPFLNTPKKKLMFGLVSSHDGLKNLKEWMENGDIVVFNMKGLNDFDRKTIIGYICLKYYTVGLSREENSLLHIMYLDESHKVQIPILQKILAELRKNGVALVPMTQYLEQYNEDYLKALLGNVATKISFRQGDDAARRLVANIPGNVSRDALKQLSDRAGYLSTEDDDQMKSVLINVDPPYRYTDGKLLPFPDLSPNHIVTSKNIEKNRKFGRMLMKRDFISKQDAEKLIFNKIDEEKEAIAYEQKLLMEGDALWDQ